MNEVIVHPKTEARFKAFLNRPGHALILAAPLGMGKTSLALWLVSQIINQPLDKIQANPQLKIIAAESKSISIDQVRELNQFLKLKTLGAGQLRRFVIIEQAESMTLEAQNAILKLLEEPPADTLIIMTVASTKALLPTVLSRAPQINIQQPTKAQLQKLDVKGFEKFYNLSAGRPGLLLAMSNSVSSHPLVEAVGSAKAILGAGKFERLSMVDALAKQKDDNFILDALQLIADSGLKQAASQQDAKLAKRWQKILATVYGAKVALTNGGQPKLVCTGLMLEL